MLDASADLFLVNNLLQNEQRLMLINGFRVHLEIFQAFMSDTSDGR